MDLFLDKSTRPHQDLDLAVFRDDRNKIIDFMLRSEWRVLEALGDGKARDLFDIPSDTTSLRSLFCLARGNSLCRLIPLGDNVYDFELGFEEQTYFDYFEFLFSDRDDDHFICGQNDSIKRAISKAFFNINGMKVLAPEIVLFYKSLYHSHAKPKNKLDFNILAPSLNLEQRAWLKTAIEIEHGDGHEWMKMIDRM